MLLNVKKSPRFSEIRSALEDKMNLPHLAVICDYSDENWPSMDLVAEMLLQDLHRDHAEVIKATRLAPPMRRRFTQHGTMSGERFKADRLLNRFWDYPRFLRRQSAEFDLFHIIDHSYGQLVHELPPERTIVTCHDLDTFRSLLNGEAERRSAFFKSMTRRIMSGLGKAARVTCVSAATRDELLAYELVAPERAVVVPNGVHPACSPEADSLADAAAARLLGPVCAGCVDILHVGSTIARKRIDVLLRVFAALRKDFPGVRLIRAGGAFTPQQMKLIKQLNLTEALVVLPHLDRKVLAAVYRRASVVLQPSEREGFGLPVIEALACATPVVASDLPVLREVGGEAALYCPVGDVSSWTEAVARLLVEKNERPQRFRQKTAAARAQAAKFTWTEYAKKMVSIYQELLCS
jgi:glycosyltransferase involved in cell wall biosynthesis